MINKYILTVVFFAVLIIGYGFNVPTLLSKPDTLAVLVGFFLAFLAYPVIMLYIGKLAYKAYVKDSNDA